VGRQRPGKYQSPPQQPEVGATLVAVLGAVRNGESGGGWDGRGPGAGGEDGPVDCMGSGGEGGSTGRGLN